MFFCQIMFYLIIPEPWISKVRGKLWRREGYIVWNIAFFCPASFLVCRIIVLVSAFCVCCQRCMRWKRACAEFSLCSTISRQLQAKGDRGWQLLKVVKSTWANECQNHYISICTVTHMRGTKSIIFFFNFHHLHFLKVARSQRVWPRWEGQGRDGVGVGIC